MSKYEVINTLDHRLAMMGFYHPDSTKTKEYKHKGGDFLRHQNSAEFGSGWYWYVNGASQGYSFSKRLIVARMEESGRYNNLGYQTKENENG